MHNAASGAAGQWDVDWTALGHLVSHWVDARCSVVWLRDQVLPGLVQAYLAASQPAEQVALALAGGTWGVDDDNP